MKPRLLSSVHGKISEILIVFPGIPTSASEREYEEIVRIFDKKGTVHRFRQEAPNCTIKVAHTSFRDQRSTSPLDNFRAINDIAANLNILEVLRRWKTELEQLERGDRLSYRRWAQDPFVTLASDNAIILLQSYYSQRLTDYLLPLQLAEQPDRDFLLKPTKLYLEGGNILCTSGRAYVGKDLIQQNQDLLLLSADEVVLQLQSVLGVEEINVIGFADKRTKWMECSEENNTTWQPLFHIDLFMTLGGKDSASRKETLFWGNPTLATTLLKVEKENGKRVYLPSMGATVVAGFDEARLNFSNDDYELIDLPIYCFEGVCFSWNNCLVEVAEDAKRVYLPSYISENDEECLNPTFETLEAEVQLRYESAGFETIWIKSGRFFRIIASHGGSLHCVVKVLRRGVHFPE